MAKRALFLCGGGALGAWQCGYLSFLVKNGLRFEKIAGFSIGAINSAFYCFDMLEKAQRLWSAIRPDKVLKFSISYSRPVVLFPPERCDGIKGFFVRLENLLAGFSIYSGKKIYNLLSRYITSSLKFRKDCIFYCISHCVETSSPYIKIFTSDNYERNIFIKYIIASSSIPFIFPGVEEYSNFSLIHLVDGGVIGRKGLSFDFFLDCDEVYVISNVCDADKNFKPSLNLADIFEKRVRRILLYQNIMIKRQLMKLSNRPKIFFITPQKPLSGRVLMFDGKICGELFKEGFKEAEMRFLNL